MGVASGSSRTLPADRQSPARVDGGQAANVVAGLRRALRLDAAETLIGFICIGTPAGPAKLRARPEVSEILSEWSG